MSSLSRRFIVFTDLDGSLLDHDSYQWDEALEVLRLLEERNIPVIFNTSKTISEVRDLQKKMRLRHPFITENGMVTSIPSAYFPDVEKDTHFFHGIPYKQVRRILSTLRREQGFDFIGFGDCDPERIAVLAGLKPMEATFASERKASEPILWQDSEDALTLFETLLGQEGLYLTRGGRFYHVSGKGNKGLATERLLGQFKQHETGVKWISIGLGDSLNDLPMLESVNYPVLIRSDHGVSPDIRHLDSVLVTENTGSRGWKEAINRLVIEEE